LTNLVDSIVEKGGEPAAGADRLAVLCYSAGRYDLAEKLVAKTTGPLSSWLRAKLALQKGDLAAAAAAYADAAKAFPKADDPQATIETSNTQLILGEQGVLALARGEYLEAMNHLYDAANRVGGDGNEIGNEMDPDDAGIGYGNDMHYVAERVLTVDELKAFVDAHAPASPAPVKDKDKKPDEGGYSPAPVADNLRWLLARRLMRAGRYDEALDYFPASGDSRFGEVDLRAKAREYAKDLHDAEHNWTDIGKAEARYAAAAIARENGMEILGFEQNPDFTDNGGSFPGGSGQEPKSMEQTFVTDGERLRYKDSMAKPDLRFHYRYVAVDEASAAADLLPPRSQAFAAVLCKATGWMMDGPGEGYEDYSDQPSSEKQEDQRSKRIKALYARYVKQGAYVDWADDFGQSCPAPDFDSARKLKRAQQIRAVKHAIRRNLPLEIGGLVLVMGVVAALIARRRKKKKAGVA
jgi:tetratricopeptide (TPR) repeat protein